MAKIYKPEYVKKILATKTEILSEIKKASEWVNKKFINCKKPLVLLCVLKGAIPFYGHLITGINHEIVLDFTTISSFNGKLTAQNEPNIISDIKTNITGKDVIVVEDVVDSAKTLNALLKHLKTFKPHSLTTVVLVDKPDMRKVAFNPDYACFKFYNNPFLIGFGLDIEEQARNLPYLAEFDKEYINKL